MKGILKNCLIGAVAVLGAMSIGSGTASAATFNITANKDNTLYENGTGAVSNGLGEFIFTGTTNTGVKNRTVLHFDVAGAVPGGSTISSVTLTLTLSKAVQVGNFTTEVHGLTKNWGEGTSDAAGEEGSGTGSTTNDATWTHTFFNTGSWTAPGGDFNGTVLTSAVASTTLGPIVFPTSASLVSTTQGWLDVPANNFGVIVVGNEAASSTARRFNSKDHATASERPVLTIVTAAAVEDWMIY